MAGVDSKAFLLNVETLQLTRALKYLCKSEPRSRQVHLKFDSDSGLLTVSIGGTSRDIAANGVWPQPVSVARAWAEVVATNPMEAAITDLRQADGRLYTRDFGVRCALAPRTEESEELIRREENINAAHAILAHYKVTRRDVRALVDAADSEIGQLWGSNDDRLIGDIAFVWKRFAVHGVEPSDIRRLIDRKSRDLWRSGRRALTREYSLFARYKVNEGEQKALAEGGDLAKAELWGPNDGQVVEEVAQAWIRLAAYGVETSDLRRLINRKSR